MDVKLFYKTNNILGEGPLWHPQEQVLYWVDIEARQVLRLEIASGVCDQFTTPSRPGALAAAAGGGVYIALEQGLAHWDPSTDTLTLGAEPLVDRDDVRLNDGKCDRQGRFWVGSLDLAETQPKGALYRFDDFHTVSEQDRGFTVGNGLGWSPDNTIMYFTDSPARKIYQYDFNILNGEINNRRDFITFSSEDGYPDGLCVDSEGYLWVCHWDGWKITRFSPHGEVDKVITMPIQRPTCCAFGGPGLNMLFITSARRDLQPDDLATMPDAGSIFVIETEYKGILETPANFTVAG